MTDRVPPPAPSNNGAPLPDALALPEAGALPDAPGPQAGGVLVIGYGNSLRTDDGVGPRVAELVAADPRLAGAVVVACHQLTPELALDMSAARLIVLVDATTEVAPGVVVVRRVDPGGEGEGGPEGSAAGGGRDRDGTGGGARADRSGAGDGTGGGARADRSRTDADRGTSSHHVGPGVLLAIARDLYGATPQAHVVSVGVADMETGDGLSPAVAAAVPAAVDAVVGLVAGHEGVRAG